MRGKVVIKKKISEGLLIFRGWALIINSGGGHQKQNENVLH